MFCNPNTTVVELAVAVTCCYFFNCETLLLKNLDTRTLYNVNYKANGVSSGYKMHWHPQRCHF